MSDHETPIAGTEQTTRPEQATKPKSETLDFLQFLVKLAIIVFVIRSFIVAPFNIPSESMQPRLLIGDYLLVSKWDYGYSRYSMPLGLPLFDGRVLGSQPERGDVVVFKAPPGNDLDYIKRVIGLPGDIVQMKNGVLLLNGQMVQRKRLADFTVRVSPNMMKAAKDAGSPYACYHPQFEKVDENGETLCHYPHYQETLPGGKSYRILDLLPGQPGDTTEAFVVPEGHVFLMGDNRDRSADSRFPANEGGAIGIVPQENLVGKAWFSVFSTDGSASWLLPWTWVTAARWDRIGEGF